MKRSVIIVVCCLIAILLLVGFAPASFADSSSTNYRIKFDSITYGGATATTSASYIMSSSGQANLGQISSASYIDEQGYLGGEFEPFTTFEVLIQNYGSQVAISAQPATHTYTVTDATGFNTGDYVAIASNESDATPTVRIASITGIAVNDITVETQLSGLGTLAVDGTDDYLYEMTSGSGSLDFSLLSSASVTKRYISWITNVENNDGYTVYAFDDGDLTGAGTAETISDVVDGTVTAGVSEYGAISTDGSLTNSTFDTQDTGFTTSPQEISTRSSGAQRGDSDILTIKASIVESQAEDTYSNDITVLYVGDY